MPEITIRLQPKQKEFWKAVEKYPIVFYGGAKGGGKSYALRNILLILISENPKTSALLIRRTYDELVSNHIDQFLRENPGLSKYFNFGDKVLQLPNGSSLKFRHLQHPKDVYNYQGQEFDFIGIDEAQQHEKIIFSILLSSNRTTKAKVKPKFLLTGNPGDIGHAWLKKLFINKEMEENEKPEDYCFVPAKVWDNEVLIKNDPAYVDRLKTLPEHLRKAYLEGDWDIFAGQYFDEWRKETHTTDAFTIPDTWKRYRAYDHGRENPACCLWFAVDYNGRVWVYRELYKTGLDVDELGERIKRLSGAETYGYTVADASIFARTGHGETIAQILQRHGVICIPSSKDRIAGWAVVHQYLRHDELNRPRIIFFKNCENSIRTIPALIHDDIKIEDVDTRGEDHAADTVRYFLQTLRERKTPEPLNHIQKQLQELSRVGGYDPEFYNNE